jgi:hypothetical protein
MDIKKNAVLSVYHIYTYTGDIRFVSDVSTHLLEIMKIRFLVFITYLVLILCSVTEEIQYVYYR